MASLLILSKKSPEVLLPPGSMWCGVLMPKSLVVEFNAHKKTQATRMLLGLTVK